MDKDKKSRVLVLVGFGPGNGLGIARAFGLAGFCLGLISRRASLLHDALAELAGLEIEMQIAEADAGDPVALRAAIEGITQELGPADVILYNAFAPSFGRPSVLAAATLTSDFAVNVVGGLVAAQTVIPAFKVRGYGTILFTGGGWATWPLVDAASPSLGKAALRSLSYTLSEDLQATGIRVGILSIMGQVRVGSPFDPMRIGQAFVDYYGIPTAAFPREMVFEGFNPETGTNRIRTLP